LGKVECRVEIAAGSSEEVEIRANTIVAVDCIRIQLEQNGFETTVSEINDYLWLKGQVSHLQDKPYHLTRTTAY